MSRRVSNVGGRKKSSHLYTYLWVAGLLIVTIALIYFEQTALLYIVATLGVTALLVVVAMADLAGVKRATEPLVADDSAAIGSGITGTLPAQKPARASRGAKRR